MYRAPLGGGASAEVPEAAGWHLVEQSWAAKVPSDGPRGVPPGTLLWEPESGQRLTPPTSPVGAAARGVRCGPNWCVGNEPGYGEAVARDARGTTRRAVLAITDPILISGYVLGRGPAGMVLWDLFEDRLYGIAGADLVGTWSPPGPPTMNGQAVWWTAPDGTLRMVDLAKG